MLSLIPLTLLLVEYHNSTLGFDPLDRITRLTGHSALVFLLLSLTISPLRHGLTWSSIYIKAHYGKRLSDWNWIIKLRRMIGMFSFFYATLHLITYLWMDQGMNYKRIISDIYERRFILAGMVAFILLIPVSITSTDKMMRLLGRNWRRIHRLVYLIAILVALHYWMLTKVGVYAPYPYVVVTFLLLGWRVWFFWEKLPNKIQDDGMEATLRHTKSADKLPQ